MLKVGSNHLLEGVTSYGEVKPEARDSVMRELQMHFRPEFLNRIDEIVLFKPLTQPEIERRMTLEVTEDALRFIAQQGFDPVTVGAPGVGLGHRSHPACSTIGSGRPM